MFAFVFDLCRPILKKANAIYEHITCCHRTHSWYWMMTQTHTLRVSKALLYNKILKYVFLIFIICSYMFLDLEMMMCSSTCRCPSSFLASSSQTLVKPSNSLSDMMRLTSSIVIGVCGYSSRNWNLAVSCLCWVFLQEKWRITVSNLKKLMIKTFTLGRTYKEWKDVKNCSL